MDHFPLVAAEEDAGKDLLEALDRVGLPLVAALWMYFEEHGEWRLVVGVDAASFEREGSYHGIYVRIAQVLGDSPAIKRHIELSRIKVMSSQNELIQALKDVVRVNGIGAVRFSDNLPNGMFIDDAVIYRMAA